jgi:opacity protein-like surface antigen
MVRWSFGLCLAVALFAVSSPCTAEDYFAIGGGPMVANLDTTSAGKLDLLNNAFFGAKYGHFMDSRYLNWLGFEVDLYRAQPNIKQQTLPPNPSINLNGTIPGSTLYVHSLAFNAIARVTGYNYKLEPYVGLGLGLNVGNVSGGFLRPEASFAPSFNIIAGSRYYVTNNIAPFIEYKYNYAQFHFTRSEITGDYRAHLLMFGIAFHFNR